MVSKEHHRPAVLNERRVLRAMITNICDRHDI